MMMLYVRGYGPAFAESTFRKTHIGSGDGVQIGRIQKHRKRGRVSGKMEHKQESNRLKFTQQVL